MIYIAADQFAFKVLGYVKDYLESHAMPYQNMGIESEKDNVKLEDMIPPLIGAIRKNEKNSGILICGTGIGVGIGANRFSGIRACFATSPQIAEWAKTYDKSNVICLVGWDDDKDKVHAILDSWFTTEYDGDEGRLKMFEEFDSWH